MRGKGMVLATLILVMPVSVSAGMEGEKVFQKKCRMCHAVNGQGGKTGPELSHEGTKRDEKYIVQKLKDPTATNPDSVMPSFDGTLSEKDFNAVVQYLKSLQ